MVLPITHGRVISSPGLVDPILVRLWHPAEELDACHAPVGVDQVVAGATDGPGRKKHLRSSFKGLLKDVFKRINGLLRAFLRL